MSPSEARGTAPVNWRRVQPDPATALPLVAQGVVPPDDAGNPEFGVGSIRVSTYDRRGWFHRRPRMTS